MKKRINKIVTGLFLSFVMVFGAATAAGATVIANGASWYESNHSCTFRFQEGNYAGAAYALIDEQGNPSYPDQCGNPSYVAVTNGSFVQVACGYGQNYDYSSTKHCRFDSSTRTEQATLDNSNILGGEMMVCSTAAGGGPSCNTVHYFSPF